MTRFNLQKDIRCIFIIFQEKTLFGKSKNISTLKGTTYIGIGMKVEGTIRSSGTIRIDGEVIGDVECQDEVMIGPQGVITATIRAAKIVVNGKVEGNLFANDCVEALNGAVINGNVTAPPGKLRIHEGAIIQGQSIPDESLRNQNPPSFSTPKPKSSNPNPKVQHSEKVIDSQKKSKKTD